MLMAGAAGRFVAGFFLQRVAQPAANRRAVGPDRPVARNIRQPADDQHELVNAQRRVGPGGSSRFKFLEVGLRGSCYYLFALLRYTSFGIKHSLGDDLQTVRRHLAEEARRIAFVARRAADLLDLEQHGVAVAIDEDLAHVLDVAALFALAPQPPASCG